MRLAKSKSEKRSLVKSSASTFSSLGLHLKRNDNLALASAVESCMFIAINGHLVVARLTVRASLALLSVPPASEIVRDFLHLSFANQPKASNATRVANSSAEVDAHWDSPEGLKRNGASSDPTFNENQRIDDISQPARTMKFYSSINQVQV